MLRIVCHFFSFPCVSVHMCVSVSVYASSIEMGEGGGEGGDGQFMDHCNMKIFLKSGSR